MPKPVKKPAKPKRPSDPNQWAHQLVRESTEEHVSEPTPDEVSRVMAAIGRRGGRIGGKRRLETMTAEQRSDVASIAARARWAKRKRTQKR